MSVWADAIEEGVGRVIVILAACEEGFEVVFVGFLEVCRVPALLEG
jgi:hypothetical protein